MSEAETCFRFEKHPRNFRNPRLVLEVHAASLADRGQAVRGLDQPRVQQVLEKSTRSNIHLHTNFKRIGALLKQKTLLLLQELRHDTPVICRYLKQACCKNAEISQPRIAKTMRPERRPGTRSEPYVFAKSCSCQKCTENMHKLQSQTQAGNPRKQKSKQGRAHRGRSMQDLPLFRHSPRAGLGIWIFRDSALLKCSAPTGSDLGKVA